ncbi:MAG: response regulator [Alphaproteobacteria bacterium]|nr:response regulator [Alphaproteobacteria bacterium]
MASQAATIFLVDDDDAVRDSLRILLEISNFNVVDFASAQAFLDRYDRCDAPAGKRQKACLVLDLHMPGMSGLALLQALAQRGTPLPAILITGAGTPDARAEVLRAGARAMLEKPVSPDLLLQAINRALGGTKD